MDNTTHETEQKTSLLRTIIDRLNAPSADRYSAIIRQRTFGRARLTGIRDIAAPGAKTAPAAPLPQENEHPAGWTKLAS